VINIIRVNICYAKANNVNISAIFLAQERITSAHYYWWTRFKSSQTCSAHLIIKLKSLLYMPV